MINLTKDSLIVVEELSQTTLKGNTTEKFKFRRM